MDVALIVFAALMALASVDRVIAIVHRERRLRELRRAVADTGRLP